MHSNTSRIYFMDSLRSFLMMLGIVYHSAQVFNPAKSWLICSDRPLAFAGTLVTIIHSFRLQGFFVVSGFFCALTIAKYTPYRFISIRLTRIAVPIISTAITLNLLQYMILGISRQAKPNWSVFFFEGGWISHLWFLNNLIIYFIIAALVAVLLKAFWGTIGKYFNSIFKYPSMLVMLLLMPLMSISIMGLNKIGFPLYTSILGIDVYRLFQYLPYFVFGVLLGSNESLFHRFSGISPSISLVLMILAYYSIINSYTALLNGLAQIFIFEYLKNLTTWTAIALCFYLFNKYNNRPSNTWFFLSDASYTVYLFHHVFVVAIGLLLINTKMPSLLSFIILLVIVTSLTLVIHKYLILNCRVLRFLFNGK